MTTNKEMAAALRELADRVERCERDAGFDVTVTRYRTASLEDLRLACSVSDDNLKASNNGGTHWVKGTVGGCIEFVAYYEPGLLSRTIEKQQIVESEVGADVSLIRGGA